MTTETRTSAAALDDVVSALRRGDRKRAERALKDGPIDIEGLLRLAELNVRRQRWADAAWLFDQAGDHTGTILPPAVTFKRNLCRNMAALDEHRPAACALLAKVQPSCDVTITASATGHPTIAVRQPDGAMAILSEQNRPLLASEAALRHLRPALAKGLAIGLAGIGDGYLLYRLAVEETKLFLTTQIPVFVFEPDPRIALHVLMIHDYSGPAGPIAHPRFHWYLGSDWAAQFRDASKRDPFLGAPAVTIGFTNDSAAIRHELRAISEEAAAADSVVRARVEAYYAGYDPATLATLLRSGASRKPRVLLPTTLFSTVLQYSNHDTARAFEALGWEARELIEPSPAHRLYQTGIRRQIDEFKPDLVLQIDHLRHEHTGMFPGNLPFVCWAQDHLPNLVGDAGKHMGPTDFVLTDGVPTYVNDFQYPASQCIGLPKLMSVTRDRGAPAPHDTAEPGLRDSSRRRASTDVIFVSNASRDPAAMLARKLAEEMHPAFRTAHEEAARRIADGVNGPKPYTTYVRIRELVEAIATERGFSFNRDVIRTIASWLYHPYCDAIYRQEALCWAADTCRDLGLTLGLYGKGWEDHPTLSPYARGPIANGPALYELTRRSLVNLQVVPYLCLHQRLLDGLCAGGFFLVREHSSDIAPQAMLDLLVAHGAADAATLLDAQSAIDAADPAARRLFESLLQNCRDCLCNSGVEDPIEYLQSLRQIGFLVPGQGVLPRFGQISFNSAAGLRDRLGYYATNPDARSEIAEVQRTSVTKRFTYVAGVRRVVETIAERLAARTGMGGRATGSGVPQHMGPATASIDHLDSDARAA